MRVIFLVLACLLLARPALAQDERNTVTRLIEWASGGQVKLVGLEGWIPGSPRVARVEVHDAEGPWLVLEEVEANWSSLALLRGRAQVSTLSAARAVVSRRPASSGGGGGGDLPMQISVEALRIARLELAPAVTGLDQPLVLAVTGALDLAALDQGTVRLAAEGVERPGRVAVEARLAQATLAVTASVEEPAGGLVGTVAGLPELGPLSARLSLEGTRAAPMLRLSLRAGELVASANGSVGAERIALEVSARAPAMAPGPGLSWGGITLEAHVSGAPTSPEARGEAVVERLVAGEVRLARFAATLAGNAGVVRLDGRGEGLVLPAPFGAVLQDAPIEVTGEARLEADGRPVTLRLLDPLLSLDATALTAGVPELRLAMVLPRLDPLHGAVAGNGEMRMALRLPADGAEMEAEGWVRLERAPLAALAGEETRFALAATRRGDVVALDRLEIDTPGLRLSGSGRWDGARGEAALEASLPDLALLAAPLRGAARLVLRAEGTPQDVALTLSGSGVAGTEGFAPLPLVLEGRASGLPSAPKMSLSARATLEDAPLALELEGARAADGTLRLDVPAASWKSLQAQAALTLAPGDVLPQGTARLELGRLEDLRAFVPGLPAGRVLAEAARAADGVLRAKLEGQAAPFSRFGLVAEGPAEALSLTLSASGPAEIEAAAKLDLPGQVLTLAALRAVAGGQAAVLQTPARVDLRQGVRVDRVRLGIGGGVLEAGGQLSPALDVSATLRGLPAAIALPGLAGVVQGEAKLAGTPGAPTGTVRLSATGLQWGEGFPPGSVTATATLGGGAAQIEARAVAGAAQATARGRVPLGAGALDLALAGRAPLALLDPILTAQGRRARGDVAFDGRIGGTLAAPAPSGTLRLARGELRDDTVGFRLHDLSGTARLDGNRMVLDLAGRAGSGSVSLGGTVQLAEAPVLDLRLVARNARPVVSDLVTATSDADLLLRGTYGGDLLASGRIALGRVEIRIPERMPARLPVLKVRVRGAKPQPAPPPPPPIALDVLVEAPGGVFVRGRGLEAELAGRVATRGTMAEPRPEGALTLRRGSFNLLGTALTLTEGRVGMDTAAPLDPAIDFAASTRTSTTNATVRVTGRASSPEIRLTSEPELPQDEILAQLLLGRPVAQLNALQLAQIAAGLAELSGKGTGLDPLGRIRGGLGLDRLALGATEGGATTLEAGRNLAPGVYLGVRQGTGDAGTKATVQIDLGRGLKLQGEVGTSSGAPSATGSGGNGNSVGLVWSREW
jgi:translocation and assembly module TamB